MILNKREIIKEYDAIILGGGIFGLYAAEFLLKKKKRVAIIDINASLFEKASYINQARLHRGYHYPRSVSTAKKTAEYFDKFSKDFSFAVNKSFKNIYAIAESHSYTNSDQFVNFCRYASIPCSPIDPRPYFNQGVIENAFEVEEYVFDAAKLKAYYLASVNEKNVDIYYDTDIFSIEKESGCYRLNAKDGRRFKTSVVVNATYANINKIIRLVKGKTFGLKYEECEVILCRVKGTVDTAITVMDGPFFSLMPFGMTGLYTLTAVPFTPHTARTDTTDRVGHMSSAWSYMHQLSRKFLSDSFSLEYDSSLFTTKVVLQESEIDDSRPTLIRVHSENPTFISVLSGKINTIYDLVSILESV